MSKRLSAVVAIVGMFAVCASASAQIRPWCEPAAGDCLNPRVIPGTPGQHVIYMDCTASVAVDTICESPVGYAVYFRVTPTVAGPLTVSTCHPLTTFDTVLEVATGVVGCDKGTVVGCEDDTGGLDCVVSCTGRASRVTFDALADTEYTIRVGAYGGNVSECVLQLGMVVTVGVPCGSPPWGVDCLTAVELPGVAGAYDVLVDAADAPMLGETWTCGVTPGHTAWFKVTAAATGPLTFTTCAPGTAFDTVVRALQGDCVAGLVEIACSDDFVDAACVNACGENKASWLEFVAHAGQTYYIEVGANNLDSGGCALCFEGLLTLADYCDSDFSAPAAELEAPTDFVCVPAEGSVIVKGSASDPDNHLDSFVVQQRALTEETWTTIATGTLPVLGDTLATWSTVGLGSGYRMLRVIATDVCGKSAAAARIIYLDAGPSVALQYPAMDQVVGGNVYLSGTVCHGVCAVDYQAAYRPVGAETWTPMDPNTQTYGAVNNATLATWAAGALADGAYEVRIEGHTACGTATAMAAVTVDNTPPVAMIAAPAGSPRVTGLVTISGTAADANLSQWTLQYAGGEAHGWVTIASGTEGVVDGALAEWDTSALAASAYVLRLVASDRAQLEDAGLTHQSEYLTTVIIGSRGPADLDGDGDVDLADFADFGPQFTGPF